MKMKREVKNSGIASYIPGASVFKEPARRGENNESNLSITQHRKLVSFLEDPSPPLGEGHLPRCNVVNLLDLDLLPHHLKLFL